MRGFANGLILADSNTLEIYFLSVSESALFA